MQALQCQWVLQSCHYSLLTALWGQTQQMEETLRPLLIALKEARRKWRPKQMLKNMLIRMVRAKCKTDLFAWELGSRVEEHVCCLERVSCRRSCFKWSGGREGSSEGGWKPRGDFGSSLRLLLVFFIHHIYLCFGLNGSDYSALIWSQRNPWL